MPVGDPKKYEKMKVRWNRKRWSHQHSLSRKKKWFAN